MSTAPAKLNPFPGLRPFTREEDYLFFGREEQTLELLQLLGSHRFVAVVGTSGSGKSSLVRCGLLSELLGGRMLGGGASWEVAVTHPGGNPLALLTEALLDAGLYDRGQENTRENLLATLSRSQFGLVEAIKQAGLDEGTNFLLVVDQFEEIFRFHESGQAQQEMANEFVSLLLEAAAQKDAPIYVVLTMRSDFIGECGQFEGLAEMVSRGEFLIPRLTREQYKRVIEGPIRVAGGRITPRLLQRLLNDLGQQADQLPCLQHALMRTWSVWAEKGGGEALDLEEYQRVGKMTHALSLHADEVYDALPTNRQRHLCRGLFQALTVQESENRGIRRPQRLGRLCQILDVPADELLPIIDAYRRPGVTFLMPAQDVALTDRTIIDISHESLMRVWTRLRNWVEEEAQAARIYVRLSESAALYGQKKAGLYRDPELGIALAWQESQRPNAAWAERYHPGFDAAMAFLAASQQAGVAEEQAREAARQRDLAHARELAESRKQRLLQQQRSASRLRLMLAGLGVVAAIAVGTSLVAGRFWQQANAARLDAETSAVLAQKNAESARRSEAAAQREATRANEQKRLAEENLAKADKAEQEATEQRKRADDAAEFARRNLYHAQMHLAPQAWREHRGLAQLSLLLASWLPTGESPDRRGWEWFYLNSLPYQNLRTFTEGRSRKRQDSTAGTPCTVAWHVASHRLAEGTHEGLIRIWDVDREQPTLVLRGPAPAHTFGGVSWLAWSPDGRKLAAGSSAGTVHLWDAGSGRELHVLRGHNSPVWSVAFNSDGSRVAAWGQNGKIKIWDPSTAQLTADLAHAGDVSAGAWSPDDRLIACGHDDGTVTVSDARGGDKTITLRGHARAVLGLAWSPDSTRLASSGEDFTARIWEVASEKTVLGPLRHSHSITSLAWEPDGQRLATGSADETVKIWDTTTGREVVTLRGHRERITSLAWGPDGRLASGCGDGSMRVWTAVRDQEANVLPGDVRVTAVSWSPDGKRLASGGDDGKVRVWDPASRAEVLTLQGHDKGRVNEQFGLIRSLAWRPDGTLLASAGLDGTVKVWEVADGREVVALPAGHGMVWSVAWSPDGTYLAVGSQDGTIRVIDGLKQTPKVHAFKAHEPRRLGTSGPQGVRTLAWSPQGDRLTSGGPDNFVKVWDPLRGAELARMQGKQSWVLGVAWSPDGKRLASASANRLVIVWDVRTGREIATMRGHNDFVDAVVWSPDGTRLASAGLDNSVRIWDPRTGEEAFALRGDSGMFHDVSWHPDGTQLAAASSGGQVWVWDATRGYERDTTPRALPHIDRKVASGTARGEDLRWYAESYLRAGKLDEALVAVKDDPSRLCQVAKLLADQGHANLAAEARARARALFDRQLAAGPENPTPGIDPADLLAPDDGVKWTVLSPAVLKSKGGATLTLQGDGSILASGTNPNDDVYTVSARTDLGRIVAVRLEVLPDPTLPSGGPGRHTSGNFHLSAFRLYRSTADGDGELTPLAVAYARASFDYKAWDADIAGTVDPKLNKFWHVWGRTGEAHQAFFVLKEPAPAGRDRPFVIELYHRDFEGINLGRFRLSVCGDTLALARERHREAAMKFTDPPTILAAAYHLAGDRQALEGLIKRHPAAAVGIGDLYASDQDWERAIDEYRKAIPDRPTDVALLTKLAAAYQAAGRTREAVPHLAKAYAANPRDTLLSLDVAALQAWFGQEKEFAATRRQILAFAKGASEVLTAERAAKACSILPSGDGAELEAARALSRSAVKADKDAPSKLLGLGMAEYRSGNDAAADAALLAAGNAGPDDPYSTGISAFYRAMSLYRQGKKDEARKLAIDATAKMKPLPEDEDNPLVGGAGHNDLILWLAYKEARALIRFDVPAPERRDVTK